MRGVLRTVLAWLLVLALPAQGYAAQAMLFCGPVHSSQAVFSSAALAAVDHDHAAHGHAAVTEVRGHAVSKAHASHDTDPRAATKAATAKAEAGKASSATCSVCASCCSMAAIAGAIVVPEPLSFSSAYIPTPFEPHASLTAGGLERPPKTFLA